jgi:hypothetical protein
MNQPRRSLMWPWLSAQRFRDLLWTSRWLAVGVFAATALAQREYVELLTTGGNWIACFGQWLGDLTQHHRAAPLDLKPLTVDSKGFGLMACGNVTLMAKALGSDTSALPKRIRFLLERMLSISQMRGAQAGGGALLVTRRGAPRHLIKKRVSGKREDLAEGMTRSFARAARFESAHAKTLLIQTHVRYATAGLASHKETHPHSFVGSDGGTERRVTRLSPGQAPQVETCSVQTTLTHNGDFDALRFRGVHIPYPDLGAFLERVLATKNRWTGDSPQLSGCIELFLTKGMWFESLRLAYQQVMAPRPPDFAALPLGLRGKAREQALTALLLAHPRAERDELNRWVALAEGALSKISASPGYMTKHEMRRPLIDALTECLVQEDASSLAEGNIAAFAQAAVTAFLDNDLYIALRKLEPCLEGTFGCVITSTLEPDSLIAFSRGQPLSLGFQRSSSIFCVVSERTAIKIQDENSAPAFDERLDLDLCAGEIARVRLDEGGLVQLSLYGVREGREWNAEELTARGRLVSLIDNPYVSKLLAKAKDRLDQDVSGTPEILRQVSHGFSSPGSQNAQTADALAQALWKRQSPHVLVIGITSDLWLAEQFAQNLTLLFPGVRATTMSSNAVLAAEPRPTIDASTIVLAVSQTGQDFPTLGALVLLMSAYREASDTFFVLTGETDTLLGQAAGQSFARAAPFGARILTNQCGFRPSEAQFSTVSATHLTLCELLLYLAQRALERVGTRGPHGFHLSSRELAALRQRRDAALGSNIPTLIGERANVGNGSHGGNAEKEQRGRSALDQAKSVQKKLVRRFQWHLLEGIVAFALAVLVLELNLSGQLGILPSRLAGLLSRWAGFNIETLTSQFSHLDVVFYAFLTPLIVWLLRLVQGRPLLHRQGLRELLIGDSPTNHRLLWLFSRKLFSLSYGFASLKPYSANCQDELIMTHEPVRGSLALIGLVDFRHDQLRTQAQAALMTAKQLGNSRSLGGSGAEIVTVGHTAPPGLDFGFHLALPSAQKQVEGRLLQQLTEGMFDSWERLVGMQLFLEQLARGVSLFSRYDRSRTKDQVYAPTTASPVSAASIYELLSRSQERYEEENREPLPFEVAPTSWRGTGQKRKTTFWRDDVGS